MSVVPWHYLISQPNYKTKREPKRPCCRPRALRQMKRVLVVLGLVARSHCDTSGIAGYYMEWMWPALFVGARALPSDLPAVHLPVAHAVAMDDLLSRFEPGYVPNRRSLSDPPDEKGDWASGDSSSGEPSSGMPPSPSPPPSPPRSAATVTVTLVAAGSVSDYNEQTRTNLRNKFAQAAGVRAASTLSFPTPPITS